MYSTFWFSNQQLKTERQKPQATINESRRYSCHFDYQDLYNRLELVQLKSQNQNQTTTFQTFLSEAKQNKEMNQTLSLEQILVNQEIRNNKNAKGLSQVNFNEINIRHRNKIERSTNSINNCHGLAVPQVNYNHKRKNTIKQLKIETENFDFTSLRKDNFHTARELITAQENRALQFRQMRHQTQKLKSMKDNLKAILNPNSKEDYFFKSKETELKESDNITEQNSYQFQFKSHQATLNALSLYQKARRKKLTREIQNLLDSTKQRKKFNQSQKISDRCKTAMEM